MGAVRVLLASLLFAERGAASFVQLLACSDANCSANCSVLSTNEIDRCALGSITSARQGVRPEYNSSSGELVFNYWDTDATCGGPWDAQNGYLKPFSCQSAAAGVWSTYRISEAGACAPDCDRCESLWALKMCSWVPTTTPPTEFTYAASACVACVAELRDGAGCGCAGCWPAARGGDANATALYDACARSMCDSMLEVPCMDCGEVAPSKAACEACVEREATAPALAGLCNFTLEPGGACDAARACGNPR